MLRTLSLLAALALLCAGCAVVGDYQEKSLCIAQISEFAGSMGVRRKYREWTRTPIDLTYSAASLQAKPIGLCRRASPSNARLNHSPSPIE